MRHSNISDFRNFNRINSLVFENKILCCIRTASAQVHTDMLWAAFGKQRLKYLRALFIQSVAVSLSVWCDLVNWCRSITALMECLGVRFIFVYMDVYQTAPSAEGIFNSQLSCRRIANWKRVAPSITAHFAMHRHAHEQIHTTSWIPNVQNVLFGVVCWHETMPAPRINRVPVAFGKKEWKNGSHSCTNNKRQSLRTALSTHRRQAHSPDTNMSAELMVWNIQWRWQAIDAQTRNKQENNTNSH